MVCQQFFYTDLMSLNNEKEKNHYRRWITIILFGAI